MGPTCFRKVNLLFEASVGGEWEIGRGGLPVGPTSVVH
jgi:hypothetical protein